MFKYIHYINCINTSSFINICLSITSGGYYCIIQLTRTKIFILPLKNLQFCNSNVLYMKDSVLLCIIVREVSICFSCVKSIK